MESNCVVFCILGEDGWMLLGPYGVEEREAPCEAGSCG